MSEYFEPERWPNLRICPTLIVATYWICRGFHGAARSTDERRKWQSYILK